MHEHQSAGSDQLSREYSYSPLRSEAIAVIITPNGDALRNPSPLARQRSDQQQIAQIPHRQWPFALPLMVKIVLKLFVIVVHTRTSPMTR